MRKTSSYAAISAAAALCVSALATRAHGAIILAGPAYHASTGAGYTDPSVRAPGDGVGVGGAYRWDDYTFKGFRPVRWSAGGVTELDSIDTNLYGSPYAEAFAINAAGTAVGQAAKYNSSGAQVATRAVRWNAGTTGATELDGLGENGAGNAFAPASMTPG